MIDEGVKRKIKKDLVPKAEQKKSLKVVPKKQPKATSKKSIDTFEGVSKIQPQSSSTQPTAKKLVEEPLKQKIKESSEGAQKRMSAESSTQSNSKKPVVEPLRQVKESLQVKKGRKKRMIYEIDCSGINMDTKIFVIFFFIVQ